jgi:hypothetical protein
MPFVGIPSKDGIHFSPLVERFLDPGIHPRDGLETINLIS